MRLGRKLFVLGLMLAAQTVSAQTPAPIPTTSTPAATTSPVDINSLLEQFKQHYTAQHYGKAAGKLIEAAEVLRKYKASRMAALLPPAPTGWVIEEDTISGDNVMGGGASASRVYSSAGKKIDIDMSSDNSMANAFMGLASIPGASSAFESYKGFKLKFDPAKVPTDKSEILLIVDPNMFINIAGVGMDRQTGLLFLDATNLTELAKLSAM